MLRLVLICIRKSLPNNKMIQAKILTVFFLLGSLPFTTVYLNVL